MELISNGENNEQQYMEHWVPVLSHAVVAAMSMTAELVTTAGSFNGFTNWLVFTFKASLTVLQLISQCFSQTLSGVLFIPVSWV